MPHSVSWRWKSKFARFIQDYGVLALALDVRSCASYDWIRGATTPRPAHAEIIQRLARESGSLLTMDENLSALSRGSSGLPKKNAEFGLQAAI